MSNTMRSFGCTVPDLGNELQVVSLAIQSTLFLNCATKTPHSISHYATTYFQNPEWTYPPTARCASHDFELKLIATPFDVDVDSAPEDIQMELIDLQSNMVMKSKHDSKDISLLDFYQKYLIADGEYPY